MIWNAKINGQINGNREQVTKTIIWIEDQGKNNEIIQQLQTTTGLRCVRYGRFRLVFQNFNFKHLNQIENTEFKWKKCERKKNCWCSIKFVSNLVGWQWEKNIAQGLKVKTWVCSSSDASIRWSNARQ